VITRFSGVDEVSGNVVNAVGTYFGGLVGGAYGAVAGSKSSDVLAKFAKPDSPALEAPNSKSEIPTQDAASKTAAQKTLERERQIASTSTVLTGGAGLLEQPTTTSRTLLAGN